MLDFAEISPFVIRSQCFLRLGRNSEALKDAETAMEMERCVLVLVSDLIRKAGIVEGTQEL